MQRCVKPCVVGWIPPDRDCELDPGGKCVVWWAHQDVQSSGLAGDGETEEVESTWIFFAVTCSTSVFSHWQTNFASQNSGMYILKVAKFSSSGYASMFACKFTGNNLYGQIVRYCIRKFCSDDLIFYLSYFSYLFQVKCEDGDFVQYQTQEGNSFFCTSLRDYSFSGNFTSQ
jgi:hypothetical protein